MKTALSRGFTLIELIVVIAIIGILTSLVTANFIGARQRARDAQRKSNVRQIQSALELYRSDQGLYPAAPLPTCNSPLTWSGPPVVTYMQSVPCDGSTVYNYDSPAGNFQYCIRACLENTNDPDKDAVQNQNPVGSCAMTSCAAGRVSFTLRNP